MMWGIGHGIWFLLPLLFLGKFIWLVVLGLLVWGMIRWLSTRNRHMPSYMPGMPPTQPSALEILQQRYARGEIDAATYEQMRERLENPRESSQQ
jgi:putative membrane protein